MEKFAIITDSSCELSKKQRDLYDIDYVYMGINFEDKELPASLDWEFISPQEFYGLIRKGVRIKTTQVKQEEYRQKFEKYLEQGMDILSLSCSSRLSSSYSSSLIVAKELMKKYPERKIVCIDSKNGCFSLGLLCLSAGRLRKEGKTLEEVSAYVNENLKRVNMLGTVESLTYLQRAGRVSLMTSFFGGILQIKPIIVADVHGSNVSVETVKGRKNSFVRLADMVKDIYEEHPDQIIQVEHCDCLEDAQKIVELIKERIPNLSCEINTPYVGQIVGATTGPGSIVIALYGKEVTYDGDKK